MQTNALYFAYFTIQLKASLWSNLYGTESNLYDFRINYTTRAVGRYRVQINLHIVELWLFRRPRSYIRKALCGNSNTIKTGQMVTIIGAGLVGALAYTFSDTFWYSAVEGEVYAYSSFFTAVVFWFILKWEEEAGSVHSDRWLILIAYLMGLSVGVHLLNLLCIPAIVLI